MLIKRDRDNYPKIKEFILFFILRIKNKSKILTILFLFLLFGLILLVPFDFGLSKKDLKRLNLLATNVERPLRKVNYITGVLLKENILFSTSLFGILKRYIVSLNKDIDVIRLDIKLDELDKIRNKRDEALEVGILTKGDDDEIKASISYENKKYPVKLRLKGDYVDHLIGEKWSFRIKPRKGKAFKGLTEFSFQHPRTRSYLSEYIFHLFLKESNLPHLRYEFFKLILNGKNFGTYAIEEHFTKELVEYNRLRESPIFQFSCDLEMRERARNLTLDGQENPNPYIRNTFEIDIFNKKKVFKKSEQGSQFILGKNLLSSFLSKDINSSNIFDLNNNTKYLSIIDLFGAHHTLGMCNVRLYFDPMLSRFSFIGFDADPGIRPAKRYLSIDTNPFNIFDDLAFSKEYVTQLELLTSENYLDNMLDKMDSSIYASLHKINKTFPHVRYLKSEILRSRDYIKNRLSPIKPLGINYLDKKIDSNKITLVLYNRSVFPIKINHIFFDGKLFKPEEETILLGLKNKKINYKKVKFQIYQSKNKSQNINLPEDSLVGINYNLFGSKKIKNISVDPLPWFDSTDTNNEYISRVPSHRDFEFISVNDIQKVLKIDRGNWTIGKPLIMPLDYKLLIEEGTTINLTNGGYILSQGPVEFIGKKDNRILINGRDNGGGLFVVNSKNSSVLDYVTFKDLKNLDEISLSLTGSVTFYNSPVSINNSNFFGSKSEDYLNLFRSNFVIKNTQFKNVNSDALDLDFSNGSIDNVLFENVGNDGLDISGSIVKVDNLSFLNIKDKAISVGEKSNLKANNIYIDKSFIGIASKDKSLAKVKNLNVKNLDFCLAAYNKKPEFGEGNIKLENISEESICFSKYLLEKGSAISINSKRLLTNSKDILQIIYGK